MAREDLTGSYEELHFPIARTPTMDTVAIGKNKHHIPVLLEVDVTDARAVVARRQRDGERDVSFTAWAVKCVAQAAAEQPRVHALRRGRRKLFLFADVDVGMAVYRRISGDAAGERLPMPFVIRKASEKSVAQIGAAIANAQGHSLAPGEQWLDPQGAAPPPAWLMRSFYVLPFILRRWLVWDPLMRNPLRAKRLMGTVMVTSVPMTTRSGGGGWAIPAGIHPLMVALGRIAQRPAAGDGGEPRDVLSMTVLFDHDVVDGVPMALYLKRLVGLMESAFALE